MLNAVEEIEEEVVQFIQSGLEKALGGQCFEQNLGRYIGVYLWRSRL